MAAISNPAGSSVGRSFRLVHGEIDAAFGEGLFDLLGEHALGADLGQGDVGDFVAGGLDDLEFDLVAACAQQRGDVVGLPEGELGAAGADAQLWRVIRCRSRSLRHPMSRALGLSLRNLFTVFRLSGTHVPGYQMPPFRSWRRGSAQSRAHAPLLQVEQPADQIDHGRGFRFPRRGLQSGDRRMHDLVDDAAGQRFDRHLLLGSQCAQAAAHAVDFGLANGFQVILQRDDGRHHIERLQAGLESLDFAGDDGLGALGFLAAVGDVARDTACCRSSMS